MREKEKKQIISTGRSKRLPLHHQTRQLYKSNLTAAYFLSAALEVMMMTVACQELLLHPAMVDRCWTNSLSPPEVRRGIAGQGAGQHADLSSQQWFVGLPSASVNWSLRRLSSDLSRSSIPPHSVHHVVSLLKYKLPDCFL